MLVQNVEMISNIDDTCSLVLVSHTVLERFCTPARSARILAQTPLRSGGMPNKVLNSTGCGREPNRASCEDEECALNWPDIFVHLSCS